MSHWKNPLNLTDVLDYRVDRVDDVVEDYSDLPTLEDDDEDDKQLSAAERKARKEAERKKRQKQRRKAAKAATAKAPEASADDVEFGEYRGFDFSYGDTNPYRQPAVDDVMLDVQDLERILMMPASSDVQWFVPESADEVVQWLNPNDEVTDVDEEDNVKRMMKAKKEKTTHKKKGVSHPERYPGYSEIMQRRQTAQAQTKPMLPIEALVEFYTGNGGPLAEVVVSYEPNNGASEFETRASLFKEFDWF
jgi:hypothetical protein